MNKVRVDSVLFHLTVEQQAQVYDWLHSIGYERTKERLSQPPPEGFGVATHLSSLRRFYLRYSVAAQAHDELSEVGPEEVRNNIQAAEKAVHLAALGLATDPSNPEGFAKASRWISRHKADELRSAHLNIAQEKLALAKERLALDRERMELNVSHLMLNNLAKLKEINSDNSLYDEEKIREVRLRVFGSAPD